LYQKKKNAYANIKIDEKAGLVMEDTYRIAKVKAREVLDSRGNPTVWAEVCLLNGKKGSAMAPSGASTGEFEALELRDKEPERYGGKGVRNVADAIQKELHSALAGQNVLEQNKIDRILCETDGTKEKSRLGANGILAVSLACASAGATCQSEELYRYVGGLTGNRMPVPMMNIVNGGAHSDAAIDIQEFMIVPVGMRKLKQNAFAEGIRWCSEVYHSLKKILRNWGVSTAVGDEGGFAPELSSDEAVLGLLLEAIADAGYTAGKDGEFMISLDLAASEWKDKERGCGNYFLKKQGIFHTSESLISYYEELVRKYPILSLEDPLDEEDWEGWKKLTKRLGDKVLLVGDDLFVTNEERLKKGIEWNVANAVLIKPNQIGTLTETMETVQTAKTHGYVTIMSHRSGETEDTTIADLAVGLSTPYVKMGAPCRGERTAKYNRLLAIEETL